MVLELVQNIKQNTYNYIVYSEHSESQEEIYNNNNGFDNKYENIERNKLNLIISLDQSGSMGSTFDNGNRNDKSKMLIANECLCNLIDNNLYGDDRLL